MRKTSARLLSVLLGILLLAELISCQKPKQAKKEPTTSNSEFTIDSKYMIVRGQYFENCNEIRSSINILREAIIAVYGESPTLCDDKRRVGDTSSYEYEILVGETNRDESKLALQNLGVNDYLYEVKSENVIVICGGTPEMTLKAIRKFCLDALGYDTVAKNQVSTDKLLSVGQRFAFDYEYTHDKAYLNGVSTSDLTIAIADKKLVRYAYKVADVFTRKTGDVLPIVELSKLSGDEKGVICIGASDRSGGSALPKGHKGYLLTNSTEDGKLTVGISSSNELYYSNAIIALEGQIDLIEKSGRLLYTLPTSDILVSEKSYDFPKWTLQNEVSESITDGVLYTDLSYKDENNLPYRVYLLTIDPTKVIFDIGTANDGYSCALEPNERKSTLDHMKSAVENGDKVIAGTNSGGFYIQSDYHPYGLTVKDGKLIYEGEKGVPYFAVTNDGEIKIGRYGVNANYESFRFACGGQYILVNEGIPCELNMDDSLGYTSHPRTIIGIKEDGTVLLAVIDGRQAELSNGASFAKCADLMISMGAYQAFAFDGGGSSIMIIKKGDDYEIKNSPSDKEPRKIHDSLLILEK